MCFFKVLCDVLRFWLTFFIIFFIGVLELVLDDMNDVSCLICLPSILIIVRFSLCLMNTVMRNCNILLHFL